MKKLFIVLILTMLLISVTLVVAESNQGNQKQEVNEGKGIQNQGQEKGQKENQGLGQIIRNRVKAGIYTSETGEQIRVYEMSKNRLRLKVNNVSVDCECNITEEKIQNRTRLKVRLSNGRNAEIKIMHNTGSEKALERLRLKVCSSENNCTIELKEVGKKNKTKLAYEVQAEKHVRILWIFRKRMKAKAEIDAETGEVISIKKPWWAFLALEPEE